jgi:hypothetical protein
MKERAAFPPSDKADGPRAAKLMGRRDRHTEEQWSAAKDAQFREPQGSPPPGERRPEPKAPPVIEHDEMEVVRPSTLKPPTAVPATVPRPAMSADASAVLEKVLIVGDLAELTPEERVTYVRAVCESLGLNPLTRPFAYIVLDGKLTLYARRDCADQLRKINGISIEIVGKKISEDVLTVHVRAMDKYGRVDEDIGAVDLYKLEGVKMANAFMKALTKAKRRVTLSISGLGFADESEVEGISEDAEPRTKKGAKKSKAEPMKTIKPAAPGEKKELPPLVGSHIKVEPIEE